MKKIKFFTNFNEEENWLNDMARQGYQFTKKTSFSYEFESQKPENAIIKMDYRTFKKREDFEDYCALFEDSGWEHIAGTKSSGYQYFKKADKQGSIEIFSDVDSKAGRYKRLSDMWVLLACSFIPILAALISTDTIDPGVMLDPKSLYFTPELWDLNGAAFWRAFLFETPFALFRGFFWIILPVMIMIYLYFAVKANKQYKKTQEDKITRK
ncbi:DUF2812 domain-containing protein [Paenibacillus glycanilyticus]|uniref:DUF2812 domain-containing protein n=1 Tax=Paenibacillus glycanilyticus TaxID=126569 RepID=UPI00203EEA06|nr:DUF2812 domain-containing protein [Paenibacillus glycanilyticus]MCM3629338.1 DUF2812 domain-containing protein [Paenibacillus glycanilyticus]